jgi:hypothetical protein
MIDPPPETTGSPEPSAIADRLFDAATGSTGFEKMREFRPLHQGEQA